MTLSLHPDRAMYRPGEPVTLVLRTQGFPPDTNVQLRIFELARQVDSETRPAEAEMRFSWTPPEAPAGYGVEVKLEDDAGNALAQASTAFDVHETWLEMPRYGFLSDFGPSQTDPERLDILEKLHINALQFYDWMYRHDQHLPSTPEFVDSSGRHLSLDTVRTRIEQAHARGIAAMPYTTIYAGSPEYYRAHPEQALYKQDGTPWTLGGIFLNIFDPSPGSTWNEHILEQFRDILAQLPFDGLHIDQYGDPKLALTAEHQVVDLAQVIPEFLQEAKEVAGKGAVIFNLVNDWPVEAVAPGAAAVYIEVWPPHDDYASLRDLVYRAKELSNGKPVILPAYLTPANDIATRLLDSVIAASGATHLEMGEGWGVLADPYFPKYEQPGPELKTWLQCYYDFIVRYQVYLYNIKPDDVPESLVIKDVPFTSGAYPVKKVWALSAKGQDFSVLHFINTSSALPRWRAEQPAPRTFENLELSYPIDTPIAHVYAASPDEPDISLKMLEFAQTAGVVKVTVPKLGIWTMLVFSRK
jgi:dextranase